MKKSRMATKKELQELKDYAKINVTGGKMKPIKLTTRQMAIINAMKYLAKHNKNMVFSVSENGSFWDYRLHEIKTNLFLEKYKDLITMIHVDKAA